MTLDRLLTTNHAAVMLGVQPATIRDWKRRGLLVRRGNGRDPSWSLTELILARDTPKPRRQT